MSDVRRVVHVAQPTTGGVAAVATDYVRHQSSEGLDVHLVCPSDGWLAERAREAGAVVHGWAATRSPGPSSWGETRRLARLLEELRPDLLHLHSAKAGLAGRLAARGRVVTVFQPHAWSFHAAGRSRRAALGWERAATRWTDLLVCVSQDERLEAEAAGVHAPTEVVPNGIDLSAFPAAGRDERAVAREALALPPTPLVVCVGRLTRQKGQDLLLAAWPGVRRALPGARLLLVGDGPDRALLERAAGPGVVFAGDRSDVSTWLAAADVVAVPSRWEGMALAPLEAMATARSVVVSAAAGLAESVPEGAGARVDRDDGADGWVSPLVTRLADQDRADQEGRAGRAHVEAHHDVRLTTARLLAAYPPRRADGG